MKSSVKKLHWKHKNLILLFLGIGIAYFVSRNQGFQNFLLKIGDLGYLGAFLAGMLFTSTFTIALGALIILDLAKNLPVLPLVLSLCLGAVTSDFLIFRFVKDSVANEITPVYEELEKLGKKNHFKKLFHTRYFGWTLPVLGTLIIMLPLSDELGISLLGISKIKTTRFLLISLCSHGLGMFLIVSAAAIL